MAMIDWREYIYRLAYGTHPKSRKLWESGGKVLKLLSEKKNHIADRDEISKLIGCDMSDAVKKKDMNEWNNNKKKFYNVISPLMEIQLIVSHSEAKTGKVYYRGSHDAFNAFMVNGLNRHSYYMFGSPKTKLNVEKDV